MSTTPAVPADSTDRDGPPTAPVTLRPPWSVAGEVVTTAIQLVSFGAIWLAVPHRYRPWIAALALILFAVRVWQLVRRPAGAALSAAGITVDGRTVPWSRVRGVEVSDGRTSRRVRVRVAEPDPPIVLPAPTLDRGLRQRTPGTERFEAGVAELRRWAATYAPDAVVDIRPPRGATAWPMALVLLASALFLILAVIAISAVG